MAHPFAALGGLFGDRKPRASNLFEAAEVNDDAAASSLISAGHDVNAVRSDGWKPLHIACWNDAFKVLGELLKNDVELDARDQKGRTAIHLAAFKGNERSLRRMLHAGAQPDSKDTLGLTALQKACITGQLASVRLLLEFNADARIMTSDGLTAMHLAAWKAQREVVRLLATRGVSINEVAQDGSTPLHEAVRSGDDSTVALLVQHGASPHSKDKFGRTPSDLAFAAGNLAVYQRLAQVPWNQADVEPATGAPDMPAAGGFWSFLEQSHPDNETTKMPEPASVQPNAPRAHPRKQFEAWLGSILFPQGSKSASPAGGPQPYGISRDPHKVGAVGGSVFAQRREREAAQDEVAQVTKGEQRMVAQRPAPSENENVQFNLDPYGGDNTGYLPAEAGGQASVIPMAGGQSETVQGDRDNPLMGLVKAIGDKAQKDIGTVMSAFAQQKQPDNEDGRSTAPPGAAPTAGDDTFYDSDDEPESMEAVLAAQRAQETDVVEDWGESAAGYDDWGISGEQALAAQKAANRVRRSEGRLLSLKEARHKLEQMDVATTRAQGWMRGEDAKQRLAAMRAIGAAYPAHHREERLEAKSPVDTLQRARWQQPAPEQEEEILAVQGHVHDSVQSAILYAGSQLKTLLVPQIDFYALWKATDGFSQEHLLLEDVFGKVFQADVMGAVHGVRVLNATLFSATGLSSYLEAVAQLRHVHLVAVKGTVQDRGIIISDLPESGNLLYVLQTGKLPTGDIMQWNTAVEVGLAVASALQYLHQQTHPVPHGSLNAAAVLFDRNAVAKVTNACLATLCAKGVQSANSQGELLLSDIHALGEVLMQLMTLNTAPIDGEVRQRILAYVSSGEHIGVSESLQWPLRYAQAFEAVAVACLKADERTNTAVLLRETVVPELLALRGDTLRSMLERSATQSGSTGLPPVPSAPSSTCPPRSYLCPLTQRIMLDPVLAADSFIYERCAIEQWLAMGRKGSPMTGVPLSHPYLTPQLQLRSAIENWLQVQKARVLAE